MPQTEKPPTTDADASTPSGVDEAINEVVRAKWMEQWNSTDRGDERWEEGEILPCIVHVRFFIDASEDITIPKEVYGIADDGELHGDTLAYTATRGDFIPAESDTNWLSFAYEVIAK